LTLASARSHVLVSTSSRWFTGERRTTAAGWRHSLPPPADVRRDESAILMWRGIFNLSRTSLISPATGAGAWQEICAMRPFDRTTGRYLKWAGPACALPLLLHTVAEGHSRPITHSNQAMQWPSTTRGKRRLHGLPTLHACIARSALLSILTWAGLQQRAPSRCGHRCWQAALARL
jgi:hypothetical protein